MPSILTISDFLNKIVIIKKTLQYFVAYVSVNTLLLPFISIKESTKKVFLD